ncbi:DNA methyltransferase, partial [Staphylococcus warneri]|uniref:DNA methyltransferase n=1 Tax=Staphylococcus warneri TaxID=1292 RepID=UPI0011A54518
YRVNLDDQALCTLDITLTSIPSPLPPQIIQQIKTLLPHIPQIQHTQLNILSTPPSNKHIMSTYPKIPLPLP